MSKNLIDIAILGIKCDNDVCDYKDMDIKFEDYSQYLDKPCPKCGESLLTQVDLDILNQMTGSIDIINSMSGLLPPELLEGERIQLKCEMKGDGSIHTKEVR